MKKTLITLLLGLSLPTLTLATKFINCQTNPETIVNIPAKGSETFVFLNFKPKTNTTITFDTNIPLEGTSPIVAGNPCAEDFATKWAYDTKTLKVSFRKDITACPFQVRHTINNTTENEQRVKVSIEFADIGLAKENEDSDLKKDKVVIPIEKPEDMGTMKKADTGSQSNLRTYIMVGVPVAIIAGVAGYVWYKNRS